MNEELLLKIARHTNIHRVFRPFYSGIGTILMFHRIAEKVDSPRIKKNARNDVSPQFLETLISHFLKNDYAIVSLDEVHDTLANQRTPKKKFISFTFDDGYVDSYTRVYPIFRKFHLPFAVYVSTNFPDKKAFLWWYALEELVMERDSIRFTFGGRDYSFASSTGAEKDSAFHAIRNMAIKQSMDAMQSLLRDLFESYGVNFQEYTERLTLNWQQIEEMSAEPLVTIGAHTINHFALNRLAEEQARGEIEDCRKILELHTGKRVEHFSYPYGSSGEAGKREFDMVKSLGFKTATTTRKGNIFSGHRGHLECLPRIPVRGGREDLFSLEIFMSGFLSAASRGFRRIITD